MFTKGLHLTYCTNIHPGESWPDTFDNLKEYIPRIKAEVSPNAPFGIGLRLSDIASLSILVKNNLSIFKSWLTENDCYVFTVNGFPFGGFHHQTVKDKVHYPDWTTRERLDYTLRLFNILDAILPEGIEGGISTSPLSYKHWEATQNNKKDVFQKSTQHIVKIAESLYKIQQESNKMLHLDIEPEPDGLLENTLEVIQWYKNWLLPLGTAYLQQELNLTSTQAEACLKNHIRICYDVCHFAIVYEKPEEVFSLLKAEGIRIGKIQISAALKAELPQDPEQREGLRKALTPFVESTYLHQVVEKDSRGNLTHFPDLPQALENLNYSKSGQWRTHFHVPVFLSSYGQLQSTQEDIIEVLDYLNKEKLTTHLEVETYTWEVLPKDIQLDIVDSIVRELKWVQKTF